MAPATASQTPTAAPMTNSVLVARIALPQALRRAGQAVQPLKPELLQPRRRARLGAGNEVERRPHPKHDRLHPAAGGEHPFFLAEQPTGLKRHGPLLISQ